MTALNGHWFGLKPNAKPLPVLYWGGRAIYRQYDGIDILWDRQQFNTNEGDRENRQALWDWIREKGIPLLRQTLQTQCVSARVSQLVTVVDRDHTLIADPKSSGGYLYIGAWRHEATRRKPR